MLKYFFFPLLILFLCLQSLHAQETDSLIRGLQFYNDQKYDAALSEFSKILAKDPANLDAIYYQGLTFDKAKKPQAAIDSFKKVLELDSKYSGARLQLGISYFKLKSNEEAIRELEKALEEDSQNATTHLFMGFTLQQIENVEDSLIYFQTALSLDPSLSQISYFQIGMAYLEMKNKEDAKLAFELVIEEDSKTETALQAEQMLKQMGAQTSSDKAWWIKADSSWSFDDNVTLDELDVVTDKEDNLVSYLFSAGSRFDISKNSQFEIGYDFSQLLWDKLSQLDIQSHDIYASTSYGSGDWDGDISYNFSYSFLDRSDFTAVHSITPRLGYSSDPQFYTSASYSYKMNNYLNGNARDGVNHSWSLAQFWFFMESKAYFLVSYSFDIEDTEDFEFDYLGHSAGAGVKIPGPFKISTKFSYNYNLKKYQNDTVSIGEDRFDSKHTLQLLFSRPLFSFMEMDIGYTRVMSNSNLRTVDFTQNVFLIGLNLKF